MLKTYERAKMKIDRLAYEADSVLTSSICEAYGGGGMDPGAGDCVVAVSGYGGEECSKFGECFGDGDFT